MDYQPFVAAHRRHRADVTIAVRRVPLADASRMGVLALDESDRVVEWQEKPKQPKSDLASMGVYVFSKRSLRRWQRRPVTSARTSSRRCSRARRASSATVHGYWQDVGTIQSYWEANMALLADNPEFDLYDHDWVVHTKSEERAPAKVGPTAQVHRSLISHGCQIDGMVVNSVLSPGVRVDMGAVVRDSIVMFDCVIRSGAVIDRAILDKEVVVGQGAIVGDGPVLRSTEQAGAGPPEHRDHGRRQAGGDPARGADRAQCGGRLGRAPGGLRGAGRRSGESVEVARPARARGPPIAPAASARHAAARR